MATVTAPGNVNTVRFSASAETSRDPAATLISGVVLDNTDVPIEGVTVHVEGAANPPVATDAEGQFVIPSAPVGALKLSVEGATTTRAGEWPHLEYDVVTLPGANNTVGQPIYLLPIDVPNGLAVSETMGGTLTMPSVPGFALTVEPGAATFPGGSKSGVISVTVVHADKVPMTPNFGQQPRLIITIQPAGVIFDPPAKITYPNLDGLAPGSITELYSFDHDLGQFVGIGTGSVTDDGLLVESDPGVGVVKGGWHCEGNPAPTGDCEPVGVFVFFVESSTSPLTETPLLYKSPVVPPRAKALLLGPDDERFQAVPPESQFDVEILTVGSPTIGIAVGTPQPFANPPYAWEILEGAANIDLGGDLTSDRVTLIPKTPGSARVRVTYTAENEREAETEFTVGVFEPEIKLEKMGDTTIQASNKYSENTEVKATVIFPPGHSRQGETVTSFNEDITFTEEPGTAYYVASQPESTALPSSVTASLGSATITLKSLSNESAQGSTPAAAMVSASVPDTVPNAESNPLEVEQWVDEDGDENIDWAFQQTQAILSCYQAALGEVGVVANAVPSFEITDTFRGPPPAGGARICGETEPLTAHIRISPTCFGQHRLNTSNSLSETAIHEARHAWQFVERLEPSLGIVDPGFSGPPNDSDGDYWLEEVRFESADILTEFFSPKQSDTMVDVMPHAVETAYQADALFFDDVFKTLCP